MLQKFINSVYGKFYPWFLIMYRVHLMYKDNSELKKEEVNAEKRRKKYDKWYAKHGEEYEAEQERKKEERRKEEEEMMATYNKYLLEAGKDREQKEKESLEKQVKEAMRDIESKLKRKVLKSPRLLMYRMRRLLFRAELEFELYATGLDRGDTGRLPAAHWIRAMAE